MNNSILVTSRKKFDLDGFACAYAYSHLLNKIGMKATPGFFGSLDTDTTWCVDKLKVSDYLLFPKDKYDKFVICDDSDPEKLDKSIDSDKVIEIIDHREFHNAKEDFPNAKLEIERCGAAASLIALRYKNEKVEIDYKEANLLYLSIFVGSLKLQSPLTSQID